jgi:hypothetical protein
MLGAAVIAVAALQLVSVNSAEVVQGNDHSIQGDISRHGRYVAFESLATNLSPRARRWPSEHV